MTDQKKDAPTKSEQTKKETSKEKKLSAPVRSKNKKVFAGSIVGLIVLVLLGGYVTISAQIRNLSTNPTIVSIADTFNKGVAVVNGDTIEYARYVEDVNALGTFYSQDIPGFGSPGADAISDQALSRLIANTIVQQAAAENDIVVSQEDMDAAIAELVTEYGDEATANQVLDEQYGLTLDEYKERILAPFLLENAVREWFESQDNDEFKKPEFQASHILFAVESETSTEDVQTQAQAVLERVQAGEDFAALAAEYGSDGTKDTGGSLGGWFAATDVVPEFSAALETLEPGELHPTLVETAFGYHIVRLDDRQEVSDFASFMNSLVRQAKIKILLPVHDPFAQLPDNIRPENYEYPFDSSKTIDIPQEDTDAMMEGDDVMIEVDQIQEGQPMEQ